MNKQSLFDRSTISFIENLNYQIDHSSPYPSSYKIPFNLRENEDKIVGNHYKEAYKLIISDLIKKFREKK
ncbi:MAG: hypothetical protein GF353_25155 [Candidatus Lokiarchaeota archaeon]|nr:hypothetical protein [Candidatus Lokiarchaeota archaeon]